jgi:hypothetical protein
MAANPKSFLLVSSSSSSSSLLREQQTHKKRSYEEFLNGSFRFIEEDLFMMELSEGTT